MKYSASTKYISSTQDDYTYFNYESDEQYLIRELTELERKKFGIKSLEQDTLMFIERLNDEKFLYMPFGVEDVSVGIELLQFQIPERNPCKAFPTEIKARKIALTMLAMHLSVGNNFYGTKIPYIEFHSLYTYAHDLYVNDVAGLSDGSCSDTHRFGS